MEKLAIIQVRHIHTNAIKPFGLNIKASDVELSNPKMLELKCKNQFNSMVSSINFEFIKLMEIR